MKAFYISGSAGAIIQLDDGRFSDTVIGDSSEQGDSHTLLEALYQEAEVTKAEWVEEPLYGDFSLVEFEIYVDGQDPHESITLSEVSELYPLAYSTLAQAAREGRIGARRSGPKTWITTRGDIERAIKEGKLRPRNA